MNRLRSIPGGWLVVALVTLWLVYDVNGFRPPWSPIVVSDLDSGARLRQLLFGLTGLVGFARMFLSGSLGNLLVQHRAVVGLGVALLASAVWSTDPTLTVKRAFIFNCAVLGLIALVHHSRQPLLQLQRMLFGVTGIAAWISVVGWFVFPADAVSIAERPGLAGVAGHPNTLAPAMVLGFVVSLGLPTERPFGRLALWGVRAGQLIALFLSNSITSIALLGATLAAHHFLTSGRYRRGASQIAAVTAVLTVLLIGPANVKSAMFDAAGRDESLSGRDSLWSAVFQEGLERPVFGQGYGAFWYEGRGREIVGTWNPRQSHHAYVDVFVDLGAIGLALVVLVFAGGLALAWLRFRDLDSPRRSTIGALVAIGISLLGLYAFGESFLLKTDKLPMFCLLWIVIVLGNGDANAIPAELAVAPPRGPAPGGLPDEAATADVTV